jgi:hypothetical protein
MQGFERVPDAIEPLIGYRAWFFVLDGRRASLFPISRRDLEAPSPWDGAHRDWVSASCHGVAPYLAGFGPELCVSCPRHDVPDEECSCGFYATKTLAVFLGSSLFRRDCILGRVELAGKVIECTAGYRAERARIVELIPLRGTEPAAIRLARRLRLPLRASLPFTPRPERGPSAA